MQKSFNVLPLRSQTIKNTTTMSPFMTQEEFQNMVATLEDMKSAVDQTQYAYNEMLRPETWGDTGNHKVDPALVQLQHAIEQMRAALNVIEETIS